MEFVRHRGIACLAHVATVLTLMAVSANALAATPTGLSITMSPTSLRYELDAGKAASGNLTIINDGTEPYDFKVSPSPYNVSGEDYTQSFQLKPNQTDVSKWVKINAIPYHLDPGKHIEVPYQISVPAGIGPGGYYAVLFAQTAVLPPSGSGVVSRKRVGAILYLRVNGAVDERGRLESYKVESWQTEPPLRTTLRLSNQGNVHFQTDVSIYVTDIFGNRKAHLVTSRVVLPQTIRRIDQTWPGAPSLGIFKVFGTVNFLGRTEALPSHYVLIMSSLFFIIMVAAIVLTLLISLLIWRKQSNTKRRSKTPPTPPTPPQKPQPPRRRQV